MRKIPHTIVKVQELAKGAILLGPSGYLQGGYKFMALNTRKKITC
jgi:hypothetical protein